MDSWRSPLDDVDGSLSSIADDFDRLSEVSAFEQTGEIDRAHRNSHKQFNSCPARLGNRNSLKRQACTSVYEQLQAADANQSELLETQGIPLGSWPRVRRRHSPAMSVFELNAAFAEQGHQLGGSAIAAHEHVVGAQDVTVRLGNDLSRIHFPHEAEELGPATAVPENDRGRVSVPPITIPEDASVIWPAHGEELDPHAALPSSAIWPEHGKGLPTPKALLPSDSRYMFPTEAEKHPEAQLDDLLDAAAFSSMCEENDPQAADAIMELLSIMGEASPQSPMPQKPQMPPPPPQPPSQPPQPTPPAQPKYPPMHVNTYVYAHPHPHAEAHAASLNAMRAPELGYANAMALPTSDMVAYLGADATSLTIAEPAEATYDSMLQPPTAELALAKPMRMRNALERREWSTEEDQLILDGVLEYGCRWRKIAAQLPGRSDDAVRNRWNRLKDAANTSSHDGSGEDSAAKRKVAIAASPRANGGDLTGEETKRVERLGWTHQEDAMIMSLVSERGHRWSQIAKRLPGRTEHAIRNRWHRLQKMHQDGAFRNHALQANAHALALASVHTLPPALPA